jgi:hypothetical protein
MTNIKEDTYKIYKKFTAVQCKAINNNVIFNRYGWIHLSFTSGGHKRSAKDRRLRMHLFPFVVEVLKKSKIVIKETEGIVLSKRGIKRSVKYYEIANECDNGKKHITVIIRKIESGNLHFYSLRRTSTKIKKALERGLF